MIRLNISRRTLLQTTACAVALLILGTVWQVSTGRAAKPKQRPNIIFIITDQQSARMMSCAGNRWLKTPAMDYIARNGIRFERAYTTNPVCSPARIGFMTGRFPGAFQSKARGQARENRSAMAVSDISPEVRTTHIAAYLKKAGYELAYGGKTHLPKPLSPSLLGFKFLTHDPRGELAQKCAEFIKQQHQRPYYLIASFMNPHDICYYAINHYGFDPQGQRNKKGSGGVANHLLLEAMRTPNGVSEREFFAKLCPPLPLNHEPQQDEPRAVTKLLQLRDFRWNARQTYSDEDWRLHRWAYHRLTERVDGHIQVILDALQEAGQEENTVVILTSDHGDHDSSHKMEHKTALYEEAANIPFLVMHKGSAPGGRVDSTHLVSNGLDLLPTVCDYAGLANAKSDARGRSLRPLIEGKPVTDWRQTLGVESEIGRMVVGDHVKYIRYDFAGDEEQLLDLQTDPGETRHFSNDPAHAELLKRLRVSYKEWFAK